MGDIRIPVPTAEVQLAIEGLVERVLVGKRAGEDTAGLERAIDERVMDLYGLTRAEREYIMGE